MEKKKIVRVIRRTEKITPDQNAKYDEIRKRVSEEFPPSKNPKLKPATSGIGFQIRQARQAAGPTWYALAKQAGIPDPSTIRDIECGRDVHLSNLEAVAKTLGLHVELVLGVA